MSEHHPQPELAAAAAPASFVGQASQPARPDVAEEEPIKLRRRPPEDCELDITPMIDVTFLLLIFFLVTSKPAENAEQKLPYALHGTGVSRKTAIVITLLDKGEDLAEVYLGDLKDKPKRLLGNLKDQEDRMIDYVREGLNASPRKEKVILQASKSVRQREITRVATAVGKAGDVQLYAAVLESER